MGHAGRIDQRRLQPLGVRALRQPQIDRRDAGDAERQNLFGHRARLDPGDLADRLPRQGFHIAGIAQAIHEILDRFQAFLQRVILVPQNRGGESGRSGIAFDRIHLIQQQADNIGGQFLLIAGIEFQPGQHLQGGRQRGHLGGRPDVESRPFRPTIQHIQRNRQA